MYRERAVSEKEGVEEVDEVNAVHFLKSFHEIFTFRDAYGSVYMTRK